MPVSNALVSYFTQIWHAEKKATKEFFCQIVDTCNFTFSFVFWNVPGFFRSEVFRYFGMQKIFSFICYVAFKF